MAPSALTIPALRPQVYQKPYPALIRACSGLESTLEMARHGRPFLMNIQSDETTPSALTCTVRPWPKPGMMRRRLTRTVAQCWAWRNVVVADDRGRGHWRAGLPEHA